ncbi:MAG TPA: PEGA domain-containing protein [Kofleriaceae bacterium]|nr:PEGA domain-containing protein [Kofleriaceae bacterium]
MSVVAGRADAQSTAIAEQLFNEARELTKANRWEEACPKFEASLKQDPALGTRLNLATCYEHVGKIARAWGLYRESIELARKAGDSKRSQYAQKQAALLEPRLPKLVITAPAKPPAGLAVQRDGAPVSAAELGIALYVDPGAHEVTASAPGFEPVTKQVTLVEGKTATVVLPNLTPKPDAGPTPRQPDTDRSRQAGHTPPPPVSPMRKHMGLGIGGAGVVMIGVGLLFGSQALSKNDEAKKLCGDDLACSPADFDKGTQLISDGRSKATLSTVFVVAGGAAMVAGAVVFLTAPRARAGERAPGARIVPVIQGSGAGIGMVGAF